MSGPRTVQPDETPAHLVVARFLDAPRMPLTVTAYRLLEQHPDRLFSGLPRPDAARNARMAFTRCRALYASDGELSAVRATRVLEAVTARVDRDRQYSLLWSETGGTYGRFRAAHDLVGHARLGHGFDRHGTFVAWLAQDSLYRGLACRALATELPGGSIVLWTTGILAEHQATLIPTHVVVRAHCGSPGPRA